MQEEEKKRRSSQGRSFYTRPAQTCSYSFQFSPQGHWLDAIQSVPNLIQSSRSGWTIWKQQLSTTEWPEAIECRIRVRVKGHGRPEHGFELGQTQEVSLPCPFSIASSHTPFTRVYCWLVLLSASPQRCTPL